MADVYLNVTDAYRNMTFILECDRCIQEYGRYILECDGWAINCENHPTS
jgi:hypothetical protein